MTKAFDIEKLIRPNVRKLVPYSSARDEFSGSNAIFLDANENPHNTGYNRYPDPYQQELKARISELKNVPVKNIFLGNGSDEAIDLLIRAFCNPQKDRIVQMPPTYGMYQVAAAINDVDVININLDQNFEPQVDELLQLKEATHKLFFVCSPNNPTANSFDTAKLEKILHGFPGLVIIDEAYIEFSKNESWAQRLDEFPNLVVLQTLSKSWGLAGIRLGMAFTNPRIIEILNKIKAPYNVSKLNQEAALKALKNTQQHDEYVKNILRNRESLMAELKNISLVEKIFSTDANFILVKVKDADAIYKELVKQNVIVRNRSKLPGCENCLRITVGTESENRQLVEALQQINL